MATLKLKPKMNAAPRELPKETPVMPEALALFPFPVLFWNQPLQVLWANPSFVSLFGSVEEHHFDRFKPVSELKARPIHLELFSKNGRHEGYVLKNIQNKTLHVELKVNSYGPPARGEFMILIDEVESKIELQEQLIQAHQELSQAQSSLIQASKLASLGELSSGIAHELNQPLQAILGFSQELTQIEKLSKTGMEFLNDILSAAIKMREIIRSLRTFAHDAGTELLPTSVEQAIQEATKIMYYPLLEKGIEVKMNLAADTPLILANPIQLEQVLINLMSNARDAIEQTSRKDGKINFHLRTEKEKVTLSVQDNGCGMSEATIKKMFDPFFTTKSVGKGTGLGLSISYGILKQFQAGIDVKSTPNVGTTFTLTFNPQPKPKEPLK